MLNKVEIIGTLPRDPDLKALESGTFLCQFTLAVDDPYWDKETQMKRVNSYFIGCTAWEELAEQVAENYRRGDVLYVIGQLEQREIQKADGSKESKTKVRAWTVRGIRRGAGPKEEQPAGEDVKF